MFTILFAYGQVPLFVLCVISKTRDKILKPIIFSNLLVSLASILHYKFNNAIQSYLMLSIVGIILSLVYLIFAILYKNKAIRTFDNDNYIDKEKYSEKYFRYEKEWMKISKMYAILAIIYLPLLIFRNKYIRVESLFDAIIQEIIIIINYFIWSRCSKQLLNERKA